MKNVNGLCEAMRIVESACDEGEITIIGHGAMPSAPEMLVKCAEFLVKTMRANVDLIAVVNDALVRYNKGEGKSCSCGCPSCCKGEDEAEVSNPTLHYVCDYDKMESEVCAEITEYFGFCSEVVKAKIRDITMGVLEDLCGITEDEYNNADICSKIGDRIYDEYGGLDTDNIDEYANAVADLVSDYISWE